MAASSSTDPFKADFCCCSSCEGENRSSPPKEISPICDFCRRILTSNFQEPSESILSAYQFSLHTEHTPQNNQEEDFVLDFNQGIQQIDPLNTQEEIQKGVEKVIHIAQKGFVPAQYFLGVLFNRDEIVRRDIAQSTRYYTLAADAGNLEARRDLGDLYYQGIDGQRDIEEAIRHYTIAAEEGDSISQFNLGVIYLNGIDLPQDPVRAFVYMEKAAAQNFPKAVYQLGLMQLKGIGTTTNSAKGLELLRTAADQQQGEAQAMLASLYCQGGELLKDENEAQRLLKLSERKSESVVLIDPQSHEKDESVFFTIGHFYHHGINTQPNIGAALEFYRRAAATGHVAALYRLAEIYLHGDGVPVNRREAERYYELLKQKGHTLPLKVRMKLYLHRQCSVL